MDNFEFTVELVIRILVRHVPGAQLLDLIKSFGFFKLYTQRPGVKGGPIIRLAIIVHVAIYMYRYIYISKKNLKILGKLKNKFYLIIVIYLFIGQTKQTK